MGSRSRTEAVGEIVRASLRWCAAALLLGAPAIGIGAPSPAAQAELAGVQAAAALLTAAQFADSAGNRGAAATRVAAGLALLARADTHQGPDAAEAYDIAADLAVRHGRDADALALAHKAVGVWDAGTRTPD